MKSFAIDRLAPTRRPRGRIAQYQRWRHLLFLHWPVPVAVLRPLVPTALEIDTYQGEAWVGLVPFTMRDVRPWWAPAVPGLSHFHETNVRTYVHHAGRDPGVWFFSLDAANALAVWVARTFWNLPYHHARMGLAIDADGVVRYDTERRSNAAAACHVSGRPVSASGPARIDTLEHFLAERYFLYADVGKGRLRRGQVHHAPYPLQTAELIEWREGLVAAAGIARPTVAPLAHYAAGVDVEVFPLLDLERNGRPIGAPAVGTASRPLG